MAYLDLEGLRYLGQRLGQVFVRKDQLANNLTTTEVGKALDARQGKALQDALDGKASMAEGTVALTTSSWTAVDDGYEKTVTYTGVTAQNVVIVAAAPESYMAYAESSVFCSGQGTDSLTFTAAVKPTQKLTVNVLILE